MSFSDFSHLNDAVVGSESPGEAIPLARGAVIGATPGEDASGSDLKDKQRSRIIVNQRRVAAAAKGALVIRGVPRGYRGGDLKVPRG